MRKSLRKIDRRILWLAVILTAPLLATQSASGAETLSGLPLQSRAIEHADPNLVVVKFAEGTGIRLRDGELQARPEPKGAQGLQRTPTLQPPLSVEQIEQELAQLGELLRGHDGAHLERRIDLPEETCDQIRSRAEERSGNRLSDMNLYIEIHLPPLADQMRAHDRLIALLGDLLDLEIITHAYADPIMEVATLGLAPIALPAAVLVTRNEAGQRTTTPDFSDMQGYLYDAPVGVEADEAWDYPGGRGAGVRIVDIEFGWRFTHEDLQDPFFVDGGPGTDDHGTAVLGEYSGIDNGYGVVGISPEVEIGGVSVNGMSLAAAILLLTTVVDPGDIYVIELHAIGPFGDWIPMEFWQDTFDAIRTAADLGIIGCEAAGNGSEDLDFPGYEGAFDRRVRDSGAIMCGAGTPEGLEGEWFTNYGSRVDLQGWGSSVVTTCCGDLWNTGPDSTYTAGFNGTSSATPIVTGSVASLQGQALDLFGEPLTPWLAAEILSRTGSPWVGIKEIGERPNLLAARDLIQQGFAMVDVTVRDAETLLPLEGIVVEIAETGRIVISGADGHISLQMSAGDYTLHSDGTFFYGGADLPVTVVAGENQELFLDLALLPTGALAGTVFDMRLDAVAGAQLTCLFTPLDPISTDLSGRYLYDGIPAGSAYPFLVGGVPALGCAYRQIDILGGETTRWFPVLADAEDFEASDGGFTGEDNWEWGHPIGLGPGGAFSGENCWATRLAGYYETYQWINLTSPPYDVSGADELFLTFHHWYWIHEFDDGGQVQVTRGDGQWHAVTPVGGYDGESIPTLGPGFTGGSDGWEDEVFDITEHICGELQVRFRFVSDNSGIGPGWYIDDVTLDDGTAGAQAIDLFPDEGAELATATRLQMRAPAPNPSYRDARIAFRLPELGTVELSILDPQGRLVRRLHSGTLPAGDHLVRWDGADDLGAMAPAGLYYVRLRSSQRTETRPLIRVN